MYTCSLCKQLQTSTIPARKVPTHIRTVEYQLGGGRLALGTEIVREIITCHTCVAPVPEQLGTKQVMNIQKAPLEERPRYETRRSRNDGE